MLEQLGPYLGLGMQLAVTVAIGYGLDRWLDTLPWFTIGFSLLGIIYFFVQIYRLAVYLDRKSKAERRSRKPGEEV